MDKLKIYGYFNSPVGQCAYQSNPFNALAEADALQQGQANSADLRDEE